MITGLLFLAPFFFSHVKSYTGALARGEKMIFTGLAGSYVLVCFWVSPNLVWHSRKKKILYTVIYNIIQTYPTSSLITYLRVETL